MASKNKEIGMRVLSRRLVVMAVTMSTTALMAGSTTRAQGRASQSPVAAAERGKYLVMGMGCHDCHTPHKMGPNGPEPDMTRQLSGHHDGPLKPPAAPTAPWMFTGTGTFTAWAGPWGISYTANLTPDRDTGLGTWTEQQFVDTIRNGRRQGRGRELLPPMPWQMIRNMNDADLKAIFAYLRTLPAISNKVPEPTMPAAPPPAR
jgi:mono/diheme cytochrome c family protein